MFKKKDEAKKRTYTINYACLAAILTIPIALVVYFFAERLPGGKDIFLCSDLRVQYIAFAKLFWRSIFNGESIGYTFHVSLGMPAVPLYTFYSLSPFNILYILIENAELASIVLVVLKLSLAAYTFQRFSAKVLKNDSPASVAFSVAYALNAYSLIYYYNILYLDGIYMLPVIFMLIAEAVKTGRYIKLMPAYAYVFVIQFYEGYIIGFFSLLFFIILVVTEYKKDWKKYIRAVIGFGTAISVAALIGATFLYPTAVFLLNRQSVVSIADWKFDCHIWDIYKNLFIGQYQTIESPYPYIFCGIMTLYLVPCFFADRKVKKEHKIIAFVLIGFLVLCSLWMPAYRFMHCFDVPDGFGFRFAYFYPFVLLSIGSVEWKYMDSKHVRQLAMLLILHAAGYFAADIHRENAVMQDMVSNIIFLCLFFSIFLLFKKYGQKKLYHWLFLGVVCAEIIINGILIYNKTEHDIWFQREIYQVFTDVNKQALDEIKAHDQGFYRIVQGNPYDYNDGAMNDYYGTVCFSTLVDAQQRETLSLLGIATTPRMISDNGGTFLTKMLFSQKYEVVVNSVDYIQGHSDAMWTINDRVLSLGYTVSEEILNTTLNSDIAFENLNNLAHGLTGQDIRIFIPYPGEIAAATENLSLLWDGEYYIMQPKDRMVAGSIIFQMKDDSSLPVYAYFTQDESLNAPDSYYFASRGDDRVKILTPSVISLPQIIELAKDDEGKYFVGIYYDEMHSNNNYYNESYFYCYDDAAVDRVYEMLKDNQMNILDMKGSDITAEIYVPADRHILFTSIPYDEGWHILVDGEETETLAVVNDTFLAVELTEGYHELRFYYNSAVNRVGSVLSIIGIIIYIWMVLLERKGVERTEISVNEEKV